MSRIQPDRRPVRQRPDRRKPVPPFAAVVLKPLFIKPNRQDNDHGLR
jgi:hypothetical protein